MRGEVSVAGLLIGAGLYGMTPFQEAMEEGYTPKGYHHARKFSAAYEKYHFEKLVPSKEPIIPKILHQIWIGGDVPEKFKPLMQTWTLHHPDWEYKLWTDSDIESFPFDNPQMFQSASNVGAQSDIWRYEILKKYGGVYVDIDFECLQPLTPLVYCHKFFAGIGGYDYVNNAIIGSVAEHPLLRRMLGILAVTAPALFENPWYHTGPLFFTKQVYAYLKEHPEEGIVYPIKFFHPLPNTYRHAYWQGQLPREEIEKFFIPETFGVHYWAESWINK